MAISLRPGKRLGRPEKVLDVTRGLEFPIIATDASIEAMKRGGSLGFVRERLRQKLKAEPIRASSKRTT